jgi:hypothetical protein
VIPTRGFAALSLVVFFFAALFATLEPVRLLFLFFFFMTVGHLLLPGRALSLSRPRPIKFSFFHQGGTVNGSGDAVSTGHDQVPVLISSCLRVVGSGML